VWKDAGTEAAFREVELAWARKGRGQIFLALQEYLQNGANHGAAAAIGEQLGLQQGHVRQLILRLRRDLRNACSFWLQQG
jgi:hypothetical protein